MNISFTKDPNLKKMGGGGGGRCQGRGASVSKFF